MVYLALALCSACYVLHVFLYLFLLFKCGEFLYEVTLRGEHHEGNAKHSIGASGEDSKLLVRVCYFEHNLSTL